jgi:hypothetical protein
VCNRQFQVINRILRQHPADYYEEFKRHNNLYTTSIYALVSAISKLARESKFPEGTRVYRGLGGAMTLPDFFFRDGELFVRIPIFFQNAFMVYSQFSVSPVCHVIMFAGSSC